MNTRQLRHPASHSKGITLIEILMAAGLLVVLLSFAVPSFSGAAIRAEMNSAAENVRYSIQMAQRAARSTETSVAMNISRPSPGSAQIISFSSPGKSETVSDLQMQEYSIPDQIELVSDQASFVFDNRGLVQNPGSIMLVSSVDESVTSSIDVP